MTLREVVEYNQEGAEMQIEEGWKVCAIVNDAKGERYISCCFVVAFTYEKGKWTKRGNPRAHGPMAVFRDRYYADMFANDESVAGHDWYSILPCQFVCSKIKSSDKRGESYLWYRHMSGPMNLPMGTVLADAVKIL